MRTDGDQFNVIIEQALKSEDLGAVAHIVSRKPGFAAFFNTIAKARIQLNEDNVPVMQLTINVGGCRAAGFDNVGGALAAAEWRPVEELGVLDRLVRDASERDRYINAGLEYRREPSGLPDAPSHDATS